MSLLETGGAPWEAELESTGKAMSIIYIQKSLINQIILKFLSPIWNEGIAILFGDEEK